MSTRCKVCKILFDPEYNKADSCCSHKELFVCRPHPADHYTYEINDSLLDSMARWPAKFWDCCGSEDVNAPGCSVGYHQTYDDQYV